MSAPIRGRAIYTAPLTRRARAHHSCSVPQKDLIGSVRSPTTDLHVAFLPYIKRAFKAPNSASLFSNIKATLYSINVLYCINIMF